MGPVEPGEQSQYGQCVRGPCAVMRSHRSAQKPPEPAEIGVKHANLETSVINFMTIMTTKAPRLAVGNFPRG